MDGHGRRRTSWRIWAFVAGLVGTFIIGATAADASFVDSYCEDFCAGRGSRLVRVLPGRTRYDRDRPVDQTCLCADGTRAAVDGLRGFAPVLGGLAAAALFAPLGVWFVRRQRG